MPEDNEQWSKNCNKSTTLLSLKLKNKLYVVAKACIFKTQKVETGGYHKFDGSLGYTGLF